MKRILSDDIVAVLSIDDYHTIDRRQRKELNITLLNWGQSNLNPLAIHLETLRAGEQIDEPLYDHSSRKIMVVESFGPAPQ